MSSDFEKHIMQKLSNLSIYPKQEVAVALSGGSDSLALTLALNNIGFKVLSILVNHHLRLEADDEIKTTIKTLKKFNIKYVVKNWDGKYKKNLESEAREARYGLLINVCKKENINVLCIGHHMDDQIETFFLNLARGSGLDGLCAMADKNTINGILIVRPMLGLSKQDCKNYLISLNIKWCEDLSNLDIKYKRNKIRSLLNEIEDKNLITKRVFTTIKTLQEVREVLDKVIIDTEKKILTHENDEISFNVKKILSLPIYLQKSIITNCIMKLANKQYKPRLVQIENIIRSINSGDNFKRTIANLIISCKNDYIKIEKRHSNKQNIKKQNKKKKYKVVKKTVIKKTSKK